MLDLSLVVVQRIVTSQKPAIIRIRSPHTEFGLVSGATAAIRIEMGRRSFAVIRMNEQTRTKRKSGCLLPLCKTNAVVIERNAVGIKTFTTGSIYPHLLGREVQNLPELCFLPADPFFGSLALGDVRHRPDKLEGARLVFHCVSHDVDMLDRIVGQQEPIFQIAILTQTGCTIDLPLHHSLVVRMNPSKDCFHGSYCATVVSKNLKGLF